MKVEKGLNSNVSEQEGKEEKPKAEEVTEAMILEWKKQHGKIFKSVVGSESYIWRKLKRKEYVEIMKIGDGEEEELSTQTDRIYERQMRIAKAITIWPLDIDVHLEQSAGLATTLADEAILKSGFNLMSTQEL